jgi:hypothetical protein
MSVKKHQKKSTVTRCAIDRYEFEFLKFRRCGNVGGPSFILAPILFELQLPNVSRNGALPKARFGCSTDQSEDQFLNSRTTCQRREFDRVVPVSILFFLGCETKRRDGKPLKVAFSEINFCAPDGDFHFRLNFPALALMVHVAGGPVT